MPQQSKRSQLIEQLETARNSKVICYIGSTRQGLDYPMNQLDIRVVLDHLRSIGKVDKIDLLLNSFGGDVTFSWRLVYLIREYCNEFNVLIPLHSFSAGTLVAFGADEIVMMPASCIGPTDPQSTNEYNPNTPDGSGKLPIHVEDLASYINFLKDDFELKSEASFVEALKILSLSDNRIHPLALGSSKRGSQLAKRYASDLLSLHMKKTTEKEKIGKIVEIFSSKLLSHSHPINRQEAIGYGLNIKKESTETEAIIWNLFKEYETELKLKESYNIIEEFKKSKPSLPLSQGAAPQLQDVEITNELACIETKGMVDTLQQVMQINGVKFIDGNGQIRENYSWITKSQKWIRT